MPLGKRVRLEKYFQKSEITQKRLVLEGMRELGKLSA
jgi:hypothetical protein